MLNDSGTQGLDFKVANKIFDNAVIAEPDFFKGYALEEWLGFLFNLTAIERTGDRLRITLDGREFLKYLISNGYTLAKLH